MTILINNSEVQVADGATLLDALTGEGLAGYGVAVAVGNKVVPASQWETTPLEEGMRLTVIHAVCGG